MLRLEPSPKFSWCTWFAADLGTYFEDTPFEKEVPHPCGRPLSPYHEDAAIFRRQTSFLKGKISRRSETWTASAKFAGYPFRVKTRKFESCKLRFSEKAFMFLHMCFNNTVRLFHASKRRPSLAYVSLRSPSNKSDLTFPDDNFNHTMNSRRERWDVSSQGMSVSTLSAFSHLAFFLFDQLKFFF